MASILDLIKHAHESNAVEFESAFEDIMSEKMADAIDARAVEVGNSIGLEDSDEEVQ